MAAVGADGVAEAAASVGLGVAPAVAAGPAVIGRWASLHMR